MTRPPSPPTPANLFERALELHRQGQLEAARGHYLRWLAQSPGHVEALHRLGMVSYQLGQVADAVATFEATTRADPSRHDVWCNLAAAQLELGRAEASLASCDRAIAIDPDQAQAWFNRGLAGLRLGRDEAALGSFDRAVALKPDYAKAWLNRGRALQSLHRPGPALASYDQALACGIDDADLHFRRALALQDLGDFEAAVAGYRRALTLQPGRVAAHNNGGNALARLGRLDEALAEYRQALALDPALEFLPGTVLYTQQRVHDWAGHDEGLQALHEAIAAGRRAVLPFPALTLLDSTALQTRAARTWFEAKHPKVDAAGAFGPARPPRPAGQRIRIAYVSADFHDHATSHLLAGLIEAHDRRRFEVLGLSYGPDTGDAVRRRIAAAFDRFVDVREASDDEVVRLAREMEVDIAIDLKGVTRDARPGLFAARCAPLQAAYLGFPGSMAVDFIDYVIADTTVITPQARPHYREKIVTLPGCYQVNDRRRAIADEPSTRADHGLPEGAFVFCCFNGAHKLAPSWFDVFMRVLRAVPGSVLWLLQEHGSAMQRLREEAARRGVDGRRLVFAASLPPARHLARHRHADLFLDTLPYNAHTTGSDALWAGLPVLTCAGESFAARVGASLLQAVGLPQLVTHDAAAFEARAIELATRPGELDAMKAHLRERRLTLPLFDTEAFARRIEAAFEAMLERHRAGLPPADLQIDEPGR